MTREITAAAMALPCDPVGRALLDGCDLQCGDEIKPGDLVLADFDRREVTTGGGLYLLRSANGWRGCRRMMRSLSGVAIDETGQGKWTTVPSLDATAWRVVGTVVTVYRPTVPQAA